MKVAQNVTDLEQRVEVLEVEVANIEDDINDIESDLDLQTNRIDNVEDNVSQNTDEIFSKYRCTILKHSVYSLTALTLYGHASHNYRPQRSCWKVMFLHLPMNLFTGGEVLCPGSLSGGIFVRGSCPGVSVQGGLCPGGLSHRNPHMVMCRQYTSYSNAILFPIFFKGFKQNPVNYREI